MINEILQELQRVKNSSGWGEETFLVEKVAFKQGLESGPDIP